MNDRDRGKRALGPQWDEVASWLSALPFGLWHTVVLLGAMAGLWRLRWFDDDCSGGPGAGESGGAAPRAANSGVLVTIDGAGGTGKSTAVAETAEYLRGLGVAVHSTRQPSASELGSHIRSATDTYRGMALACLVAGDRHHQQAVEIEPELAAGRVVLCDRYLPSSLTLQVLDGVAPETVWALNTGVRVPEVAVVLRADPDVISERVRARGAHNRFERATDFAARELAVFDSVAEDLRSRGWPVHVIDCTRLSPRETAVAVAELIVPLLGNAPNDPKTEGRHA
ncbi:dTMP kinase [Nocardia tenerifensis]|uniref:Thymidylate kinase n=1 Tax=Nocardia tenerifensis TaxID=228006 RepID=A0A318JT04_9NOCA|nr:dTMP kinase [Nocardia tenerifensis]PXX53964.1 dTMP kinase [Nocardia tenerifensis]